jgi:cyclopropane fatty-acyl-phospholipid synthase-like methyltransferase
MSDDQIQKGSPRRMSDDDQVQQGSPRRTYRDPDAMDDDLAQWRKAVRAGDGVGAGKWVALFLALVIAGAGVAGYFLFLHKPPAPGGARDVKILLPHEQAKITIDNKEHKGSGLERTITGAVASDADSFAVSITWEPNDYTKITRKRIVNVKKGEAITADLRTEDPDNKDDIIVRFVPTPDDIVAEMCKLAKIGPGDVVYDLGCGDGRMVITAVKDFKAKRGVGIDRDEDEKTPDLIKKCREKAKEAGLTDKQIEFRKGDVLKVNDLSDATVVLLYMGDDINNRLQPILQKTLKPGARVVSHRFLMKDWKQDRTETVKGKTMVAQIHLWEVKEARDYQLKIKLLRQSESKAAEAEVKVDGKAYAGKGATRKIKISTNFDYAVVWTMMDPNNYTTIKRKVKVMLKPGVENVVDMTKAQPDDDIKVRFVPTPQDIVEEMCKLGRIGPDDVVYDLGCGDGRMVITAVKQFKAKRGVGIDLDEDADTPNLIKKCREKAREAGLTEKQIEFRKGDVLKVHDLSDATVVLLYMGNDINARLRPILKKTLKPGARVVSHRFHMGENGEWDPDKKINVKGADGDEYDLLLWEIKAPKKNEQSRWILPPGLIQSPHASLRACGIGLDPAFSKTRVRA